MCGISLREFVQFTQAAGRYLYGPIKVSCNTFTKGYRCTKPAWFISSSLRPLCRGVVVERLSAISFGSVLSSFQLVDLEAILI